jgi:protein-disulfide isomerase
MEHGKDETSTYVLAIAILLGAMFVSAAFYMAVGGLSNDIKDLKAAVANIKITTTTAGGSTGGTGTAGTNSTGGSGSTGGTQAQVAQVSVDYSDAYFTGKSDGKVVLVEYSDFQCPYCARAKTTVDQVKGNYSELKLIFRQFPLPASMHPNAQKAAEASECAGKQGKFWEMYDKLFTNQAALSTADLKNYASQLGLNTAAFDACLDNGETASLVSAQSAEGSALGVQGTPSFLIYSAADRSAATEAKLSAVATKLAGLGVSAEVVEVDGAGAGIFFSGALPYSYFQEIMAALGE